MGTLGTTKAKQIRFFFQNSNFLKLISVKKCLELDILGFKYVIQVATFMGYLVVYFNLTTVRIIKHCLRGFKGLGLNPENYDFRTQFDLLNVTLSPFLFFNTVRLKIVELYTNP